MPLRLADDVVPCTRAAPYSALGAFKIEAQRATMSAECARRGWQLLDVVTDAGYSAKDLRRPGITSALERLRQGQAGTLLVAKLDRLSRSLLDFAALMERSRREGWALVALDLGVDTTTPSGELMAGVMAQFAHYERRLIGQRTKDALAVKRAQGVPLGRPQTLPPAVVARILSERQAGAGLTVIADGLNRDAVPTAQGGRCWYPSTVRAVLASQEAVQVPA